MAKPKISESLQSVVDELLEQGKTYQEIVNILKDQYNLQTSISSIARYVAYRRYQALSIFNEIIDSIKQLKDTDNETIKDYEALHKKLDLIDERISEIENAIKSATNIEIKTALDRALLSYLDLSLRTRDYISRYYIDVIEKLLLSKIVGDICKICSIIIAKYVPSKACLIALEEFKKEIDSYISQFVSTAKNEKKNRSSEK